MEIHAPHEPITGWRQTVKHLAIITAGVLIALTLEGVVSWVDHRMLVREAVANLSAEIRSNKKELDGMFANLDKESKQLEHADALAQLVLDHHAPEKMTLELSSNAAELKNAAVTTGQITGAFGYMDYEAVRRYADVYDLQAQFMRLQEREGQNFLAVLAFVRRMAGAAPPGPAALEEWRARIHGTLAGITVREQMAHQLLKRYDEILAAPR
jgi:hypothetical protein